jgi:hypothetical protein
MKERKAAFFQEVLLKTRAGRIRWQQTANDSAFCAIIPGGYAAGLVRPRRNKRIPKWTQPSKPWRISKYFDSQI